MLCEVPEEKKRQAWLEIQNLYDEAMQPSKPDPDDIFPRELIDPPTAASRIQRRLSRYKLSVSDNEQIRNFLRPYALKDVEDFLSGRRHISGSTDKASALSIAQEYERTGVLNLEEDAELFDRLTT